MNEIIESEKKRGRGRPMKDTARRNRVKTMMNDDEISKLRNISRKSGLSQMDIMRIGTGMFVKQLEKLYPDVEIGGVIDDFESGMYDDFELDEEEN